MQNPITRIEPQLASRLAKQSYHLVGEHGGVKVCHWTKQSLIADRSCYKGTFYGIQSHGCMQMAPNVDTCNLACTYCWREPHSDTLNKIDDDPYDLFLQSVRAHRRLITGFGGHPSVPREKWVDAQDPKHVAISLNGEPTLYSRLSEFLEICHQHGVSTFLVTNGSLPKVIEKYIAEIKIQNDIFSKPNLYKSNPGLYNQTSKKLKDIDSDLKKAEQKWLDLEIKSEILKSEKN